MEIIEIILEAISAIFFRKGKKKKSASDGRCPVCGVQVFLLDKEIENGRFVCKKCGSLVENSRLNK